MKKKEIQFCLRMDKETFEKLKFISDYFDRSLNSQITIILRAFLSKWNKKKVEIRELPKEIEQIQDSNWEKEYEELVKRVTKK